MKTPWVLICISIAGLSAIVAAFRADAVILQGDGAFNIFCIGVVLAIVTIFNLGRVSR